MRLGSVAILSLAGALMLAGCAREPVPEPRFRADVIDSINAARAQAGLRPVAALASPLTHERARRAWSHRNGELTAGHRGFASAVTASDIPGPWNGEALYRGPARSSAREIVATWMASKGHRDIVLKKGATICSSSSAADDRVAVAALVCGGGL